jgi:hypothetical protein
MEPKELEQFVPQIKLSLAKEKSITNLHVSARFRTNYHTQNIHVTGEVYGEPLSLDITLSERVRDYRCDLTFHSLYKHFEPPYFEATKEELPAKVRKLMKVYLEKLRILDHEAHLKEFLQYWSKEGLIVGGLVVKALELDVPDRPSSTYPYTEIHRKFLGRVFIQYGDLYGYEGDVPGDVLDLIWESHEDAELEEAQGKSALGWTIRKNNIEHAGKIYFPWDKPPTASALAAKIIASVGKGRKSAGLRQQVLKLASSNPEFRSLLLPLLKRD